MADGRPAPLPAAQEHAAAPQPPPVDPKYRWPAEHDVLSTHVTRLDGPEKVSGRARYTFDVNRPGMLYGRIVRSPYPHARVVSIDLSAAKSAPGVKAAIAWKDPADPQRNTVMYQGDEVAAVAADTEEHALDAARLVKVQYQVLPHLTVVEQALSGTAPQVFTPSNIRQGATQETGDLAAGFAQAAHVVEQTYMTHVITHVCLETHGAVCEWDGDRLTAWVSTQAVMGTREGFASALKIPAENVRVITQYMGGGFGSKMAPDAQGLICAHLAREAARPVKLMLDRKEEHLATGNRPSAAARIKAGVSADGMLTAFDAESWGTGGAGAPAGFPLPYIYQFPNRRRTHRDVFINTVQQRPMRAPGHPQGCFITEVLMDELADAVKMDPVEFRIRNLPAEAPNAMWRSYLRQGAQEFGWDKRHPTGDPAPGPIKTGMGVAVNTWGGGGRGPSQAHCEITSDGLVVVRCASQDLGTGTRTMIAVVAAETFGLPPSAIRPEIGDSMYPISGASGGSTTAAAVTPAVRIATVNALDALKEKVGASLGVAPASLVAAHGRIHVKGDPSKGLAWADACKLLGTQPVAADGSWQPGLSSVTTSGVQFAEVAVDVETGIVRVKRVLVLQDCGLVVSRLTTESQVYGGVVGSLNFALFEDRILDRNTGQMVNPNMEWYLLAGMSDIPPIEVRLMDQPERGVIGIGEPPTVSTSAAITNAVRNAIGVTVRSLPLTPAKILQTLAQQQPASSSL